MASLPLQAFGPMIRIMDIHLTPEMATVVRYYMAHGAYPSPSAVVAKALQALCEVEGMPHHPNHVTTGANHDQQARVDTPSLPRSPLLQWLQTTAGPRVGLEALHRRLAPLAGSLADTVRAERDERL